MSVSDALLAAFYSLARGNGAYDVAHGPVDGEPGARPQWFVRATMPNGVILGPSAHDLTEAALRAAETLLARAGCAYCGRRRAIPVLDDHMPNYAIGPVWRAPCRWYLINGEWRPGCQRSPKQ